jgi:hypothetical protein
VAALVSLVNCLLPYTLLSLIYIDRYFTSIISGTVSFAVAAYVNRSDTAKIAAETAKNRSDIAKIVAETVKISAETAKITVETARISARQDQLESYVRLPSQPAKALSTSQAATRWSLDVGRYL